MTVPRVTEILARVGLSLDYARLLPPEKLDRLRRRGSALHKTIQLFDQGTLDVESVHPEILPGLEAYQGWKASTRHVPWVSEVELTNPEWDLVGHPDRVGLVNDEPAIIDWKFTDGPDLRGGRYQLAGYKFLWNTSRRTRKTPDAVKVHEVYLVALSPTSGKFTQHRLTDAFAEQVFQAAVILHRALTEER